MIIFCFIKIIQCGGRYSTSELLSIWLNNQPSCVTPRLNTLHGYVEGQRAGIVGSWRERQGNAAAFKAGSAKHPCVHEIRVSTSDSCCWVVTVKQIMSAGGSGEIPLSCSRQWLRGCYSSHRFCFINYDEVLFFVVDVIHLKVLSTTCQRICENIFLKIVFFEVQRLTF